MAPRSNSTSTSVVVGIVRAAHGIRGEVRVEPMTDRFEERFRAGSRLESDAGPLTIAAVRGTSDAPIVRFEGVADRTAAEKLRDHELRVARERRPGEHLWADLIGKRVVTPDGTELGTVTEVLRAGGADVLVVGDHMLPMLESVIRDIGDVIVAVPQEEA